MSKFRAVSGLKTALCGWKQRALSAFCAFALANSGNVSILYGLCLVPTIAAVGAAVDMGQAVVVRKRLSQAIDAAGLAIGATPGLTADEIQERAQLFFSANYPANALGDTLSLIATQSGNIVTLTASASVDTAFLGILGIEKVDVSSVAEIVRETRGLEVAMALDNTGSMADDGKISALKTAMTDLITILFGDSANPEKLKMGIVPFSETVRLNTTTAINNGWIDTDGTAPWAQLNFSNGKHPLSVWASMKQSSWAGCVEARANGLEETDTAPAAQNPASRWVPFFNPDEPDNPPYSGYGQNWTSDGVTGDQNTRLRNANKYVNKKSTKPNADCSMQPILALTNSKSTLLNYVNQMQTTGYTHIAIGAAWGWRVLSPTEPFTEGSAYGDEEWQKAMVLMTDGVNTIPTKNTWHKSDYTAYGYLQQGRLGTTTASTAVTEQNSRVGLVCTRMKDLNIRIYTILFMEDNPATYTMMRDCATSPELFFDTPSTEDLQTTFQVIANDLSNLRVSK